MSIGQLSLPSELSAAGGRDYCPLFRRRLAAMGNGAGRTESGGVFIKNALARPVGGQSVWQMVRCRRRFQSMRWPTAKAGLYPSSAEPAVSSSTR